MKALNPITAILVVVGGINWGLVALAKLDLVAAILGEGSALSRLVYGLVGASAAYQAVQLATGLRENTSLE